MRCERLWAISAVKVKFINWKVKLLYFKNTGGEHCSVMEFLKEKGPREDNRKSILIPFITAVHGRVITFFPH